MDGKGKRVVFPFIRQYFWKFIGYVLSAVTYGNKVHKLWSEIPNLLVGWHLINYEEMFAGTPIYIRSVVITIVLFKSMIVIGFFILYNFVYFLDVSLSIYLYLFITGFWYIHDKV